jgi:sigma-B regulation protein RsbU (phosphoserine phosphatase)
VLRKLSIARRITVLVVLGAGIVLAAVSINTYYSAGKLLERRQRAEIQQTLHATVNRIESVENGVEKSVQGLALAVEGLRPSAGPVRELLRRTVALNPALVGAAVAYDPATYGPVAPYAYVAEDRVAVKDLGRGGAAYEMGDWFQIPYHTRLPAWTEPYYDAGGAGMVTATYAVPIRLTGGPAVSAVVTGDVSLTWLTDLLEGLDLGETGYAFLISQNGTFIAHPRRWMLMNESIFSVAETRGDRRLRSVGRRMTDGRGGFVSFDGLEGLKPGVPSYLAFAPITTTGWSLGIVYADSEINGDLVALGRIEWAISLAGLAALVVIVLVTANSITRPLHALDAATQTLAHGDLDAPLPQARGRDEVAHLTTSFSHMRDDLRRHIEELRETTAARERIESELRVASDIQMSLVPRTFPPYPERHDLELAALLEPAREVGGDFYDFFLLDDDHLCLAIADVSGKGMPAALLMAVTRSFLRSFAREGGSPAEIAAKVNAEVAADNEACMFVTMFLAIADLRTGAVVWASAGHNRPFVVDAPGGVTQTPRVKGVALGATAAAIYDEDGLRLRPGDSLFLYTDGVSEAMDAAGRVLGEDRLAEELARVAGAGCAALLTGVRAAIAGHAEGVEQSDDITMLAFRYLGGVPDDRSDAVE